MKITPTKVTNQQLKILTTLFSRLDKHQIRKIVSDLGFNPYPSHKLSFKKARKFIEALDAVVVANAIQEGLDAYAKGDYIPLSELDAALKLDKIND